MPHYRHGNKAGAGPGPGFMTNTARQKWMVVGTLSTESRGARRARLLCRCIPVDFRETAGLCSPEPDNSPVVPAGRYRKIVFS